MTLSFRALRGEALDSALDDLARLRITVFRDWPYLYDGDLDYERGYLETYRQSAGAIMVGAFEGVHLVGAATGTPMEDHADDFGAPFLEQGYDLSDIFYCAESVLLSKYRGQGAGHAFFDLREAHARDLGRGWSSFCGVVRPDHHPARPAGYRSLDAFWRKRGYAPIPGSFARYAWKDLDDDCETEKSLQFWIRRL